jgi:heat shock protein HslJ
MRINRRSALTKAAALAAGARFAAGQTAAAHGDDATPAATPEPVASLIGRRWHLVSIAGANGTQQPPAPPQNYWIVLWKDGSQTAQVDCNGGRGSYTVAGDTLTIGPLATTRKFCPEPSLGDPFALALGQQQTVALDGDTLTLTGADGTILTFGSVLKGAVWSWVATTHPGSDAVVTNAGRAAAIQLFPTGQVFVTAPCNSGSGSFTLEGDSLRAIPAAAASRSRATR